MRNEKRKRETHGDPTRADDRSTTSCTTTQKISVMASRRKSKKIVRHWKPQVRREIKMLPATVIFSCPSADGDMISTSPRRTFPWQSSIARTMGQSAIRSQFQKITSFRCHVILMPSGDENAKRNAMAGACCVDCGDFFFFRRNSIVKCSGWIVIPCCTEGDKDPAMSGAKVTVPPVAGVRWIGYLVF